jgi:L-alanine-DL-glutamate epimerase-like enolase superfamily enzyme
MTLKFHPFNLELKDTFTVTYGSRDFQKTLIVELDDGEHKGYGEAAAIIYYGVGIEEMIASLEAIRPLIEQNEHLKPEELWKLTSPHLQNNRFAQCALDLAMHDLYGKKKGLPLYKLWGLDVNDIPLTNYTIAIDSIPKMVQKMKDFPWPLYKIKLGTKEDVEIVRELRKHTDAVFRVDANGGWTAEQAITYSHELKDLNVEFIEQPLKAGEYEGMKDVFEKSALPLIADESCIKESDVRKCYQHFHGINVKLTKCGGLTPGRRMIAEARSLGMKVMVGCMTESTIGISAIAQLLPLLDYVDMDGPMLLKSDIADGVKVYDMKVHYPQRNGTGAKLIKS